ncbi:DUF6527 family protein [Ferrimicrobium sp.]|uniref:DUF6527 family protein n=1 Tax=Ferrimicrobium sp. TaxID=2926050 RepID=UPI00345E0415
MGRWQLPCKSHYWIRSNKVIWPRAFSEDEVHAVLAKDPSVFTSTTTRLGRSNKSMRA